MQIGPARGEITVNGTKRKLKLVGSKRLRGPVRELVWCADTGGIVVKQTVCSETAGRLRWHSRLLNRGKRSFRFDHIHLLGINGVRGGRFDLGANPAQVRVLEQSANRGQVRSVGQIITGVDGRVALDGAAGSFVSHLVTMIYSPADRRGLLVGFETFDRWHGCIRGGSGRARGRAAEFENVDRATYAASKMQLSNSTLGPNQGFREFSIGFAGGGVPIEPEETVELEQFVIEVGDDPFAMLEDYGDRVARTYRIGDLPRPFANWCSWYPYRLGVTEDVVLKTARIAKERHLGELGLRFVQVDLGWQRDNVPTYFEENERFSHGLQWLSEQLKTLGFDLGVWTGFTCVIKGHEIFRRHKDWLVGGEDGKPVAAGEWFWEPHGTIYNLDPTHPDALAWVRQNVGSLAQHGVGYLKWDFGGNVTRPGSQYDPKIARGEAAEGIRRLAEVVQEAMNSAGEEGLVLDCTGVEVGGIGRFKLSYANYDTGNTGLGFGHLGKVYTAFATHLFKNRRWMLLQPSCLVVGLPGTLEEARVRATATFLAGGHVDISDDLMTLPEERWQVLLSILPANDVPAKAVDLYYPVRISSGNYEALCRGEPAASGYTDEPQGANVWHAHVKADWDEWELVAVFNLTDPETESSGAQLPKRFEIPFELLNLDPTASYWAHEFWSCQFLGGIPVPRRPKGAYRHPGDATALVNDSGPGVLDITFCGPSVKLFVVRKPRTHPWPLGTTFHQSGGRELRNVKWDAESRVLGGELRRPAGQRGDLVLAGIEPSQRIQTVVGGRRVAPRVAANSSVVIPVTTCQPVTEWRVQILSDGH